MATPGPDGPSGTKPRQWALPEEQRSKASRAMTDRVNFEATRPVSADPAVALAEALGQLPQTPLEAPAKIPSPKAKLEPKISVESLAQELGLKLGDQNELTIRRVKRGKSYSFI